MNQIIQPVWRVLDGNCASLEEARVCICLTNHKKVGIKDQYKEEISRKVDLLSNPILLTEHPDDTKHSPIPAVCWENPTLLQKIDDQSRKFEFLLKGVENLLSGSYPLNDKVKAAQHIKNNGRNLELPVNEINIEYLKDLLKDIEANKSNLLQAQKKLAGWLKEIHHAYQNQTVRETFCSRQTDLINKIGSSVHNHSHVITFCGKSHANPQSSIDPPEAERLVNFVKSLQLPYMIVSIEG